MTHWIWANQRTEDAQARIATIPPIVASLDLRFDQGLLINRELPVITLDQDADSQGALTDNLVAPGVRGLVFSSRLRSVLAAAAVDNVQYFPLVLRNTSTGIATDDYMVANIVGRISCVDRGASSLETDPYDPDRIEFINALVLDENRIADAKLFRLHEFPQVIVVSSGLKELMVAQSITGIRFYAPADFTA